MLLSAGMPRVGSGWTDTGESSDTHGLKKRSGGTIRARFGYSYHNSTHYGSWFTQSAGTTKSAQWKNVYINDCQNLVGFLNVDGQGTFYNAPVTGC
ncbi:MULTISPECIES: hypothetical protein [unclassified Streptomyces]|uniref:Uncharacterized protein n=2 Tax=Streptomyces TaxID=1883 RepID=A0ABP4DMS5_9ACTN|nr:MULTISPECIES: hypothetical protein [unclassified Streptomyces]